MRTDLLNGDALDSPFTRNADVDAYLEPLLGNFSIGSDPGGTVPAPDISYFTKITVQSRDQLLQYVTGLDPNMIIPPYPFTNFEFDTPDAFIDMDGLYFGDPLLIQRYFITISTASPNSMTIANTTGNYDGFVRGPVQFQSYNTIFQLSGANSRFFDLQGVLSTDVVNLYSTSFVGGDLPNLFNGFDRFVWERGRIPFSGSSFEFLGTMGKGINIGEVELENLSVPFVVANDFTFSAESIIIERIDYAAAAPVALVETTAANITEDQGFRIESCFLRQNGVLGATLVNGIDKGDPRSDWSLNKYDLAENTEPGFWLVNGNGAGASAGNAVTFSDIDTDFTLVPAGQSDWWTVAAGVATYNGRTPISFDHDFKVNIRGGIFDTYLLGFEVTPFGLPSFVAGDTNMTVSIATAGNDRAENQVLKYRRTFSFGDTIRTVYRKDAAGNQNITLLENSVWECKRSSRN